QRSKIKDQTSMRGRPTLSVSACLCASSSALIASGRPALILSIAALVAAGSEMSPMNSSFICFAGPCAAALSVAIMSSARAGFALSASRIFFARSSISGVTDMVDGWITVIGR
ncbi:hypothetical protein PFISCL1PPCAC_18167, partial [Pristionchus fissidentatus]